MTKTRVCEASVASPARGCLARSLSPQAYAEGLNCWIHEPLRVRLQLRLRQFWLIVDGAPNFFKIGVNQVKRKQKDKKLRVRYCANLFASKDKVIDRRLTIKSQAKSKKDSPV